MLVHSHYCLSQQFHRLTPSSLTNIFTFYPTDLMFFLSPLLYEIAILASGKCITHIMANMYYHRHVSNL